VGLFGRSKKARQAELDAMRAQIAAFFTSGVLAYVSGLRVQRRMVLSIRIIPQTRSRES